MNLRDAALKGGPVVDERHLREGAIILRAGKKRHHRVVPEAPIP